MLIQMPQNLLGLLLQKLLIKNQMPQNLLSKESQLRRRKQLRKHLKPKNQRVMLLSKLLPFSQAKELKPESQCQD